MESYIYDIIYNNLVGGDTEGFLFFIEEKNLYIEDENKSSSETLVDEFF